MPVVALPPTRIHANYDLPGLEQLGPEFKRPYAVQRNEACVRKTLGVFFPRHEIRREENPACLEVGIEISDVRKLARRNAFESESGPVKDVENFFSGHRP